MNEFLIQLQAILDAETSKGNINKSLTRIQNNLNKLKVQAEIDPNALLKITKQLQKALSNPKINMSNIGIDSNSSIKQAEQIGQKIGLTISKSTEKNINIDKLNADIKTLVNNLNNFSSKNDGFDSFKTEINGVEVSLDSLISKLSTVDNTTDLSTIRSEANALKTAFTELSQINEIQLSIDNSRGASEYQNRINAIIASLERYGVETKEAQNITASLQSTFDNMKGMSGQELIAQADKLEREFKAVKASVDEAKLSYDKYMQPVSNEKATSLINRINNFLTKNTKITQEAKATLQGYVQELEKGVNLNRWNKINGKLKETENSMRLLGRLGMSLKNQMSQAVSSFSMWFSASTLVMKFISETREAVSELKSVDTYLTEISKTNHSLTSDDLLKIGSNAYDVASKYGKAATDYLSGVQDMSRAGYQNAEAMAEVSTAAQGAGDMTAEVANKMVIATDKAYKLGGSVEELTKILDGVNWICDNNAVNMSELSEGMSIVGSTAASLGVDVNELTAVLGTMAATTQQSGSEVARAFKAILLNIRQVSDEEEGIDAEGLTKYENACNALGVSLKETKDGILQTRDAMEVLKELSEEYNKLDENDIRRTDLLNSVGGKLRSTQLDALLRQWDTYENMLQQFSDGSGTMAAEAEKTAQSWEGSLNRLHNTWVDTIGNIAESDAIITIINSFNGLLSVVNNVTSKLGSLKTIGLGAGLFAGIKNVGEDKMYSSICYLF